MPTFLTACAAFIYRLKFICIPANLEELQNEERRERENFKDQIEDLKAKCQEKQEIVNQARYSSNGFTPTLRVSFYLLN